MPANEAVADAARVLSSKSASPLLPAAIAAAVALALAYYFAVHYVHTHVKASARVRHV